ncbi:MAG: ATP-dependent DNA helicase RecG [Synechococcales cyanobacterium]
MTADSAQLQRLHRALAVEAETGFADLRGKQQRFSQFLAQTLSGDPPADWDLDGLDQRKWQELGSQYHLYDQLPLEDRQHLVAETRRWLHQIRQAQQPPLPPAPPPRPPKTNIPLDQPLQYLKGVGPRTAAQLAKLGLHTLGDILHYFPRDYVNYSQQTPIRQAQVGESMTILATIKTASCFTSPKNKSLTIFNLRVADASGWMILSRFFAGKQFAQRGWQENMLKQYPRGATIAASGLVKRSRAGITLDNPQIEVLDHEHSDIRSLKIGKVLPLYPLTEGVTADLVRKTVLLALEHVAAIGDPLPPALKKQHTLMDRPLAIQQIHFPETPEQLREARRRLVFDEFFLLQLGLLQRRWLYQQQNKGTPRFWPQQGSLVDRFYQQMPFQLTGAQQRVVNEILADMQSPHPMNRLVQGDVGSGKTVVGVIALLAAIQSGWQTALMAPTEVLAEQHYRKLVEWLTPLHLPVELLTGSVTGKKRQEILRQLQTGELPVLVGTHALIQPPVVFQHLGLVIIDEQHRFGVEQRHALFQKGQQPDVLSLTATPIPRTLTLTLHGDLDVSQIDELPPGRKPIRTTVVMPRDRPHVYALMEREIAQGRQVYIVLPLVEESEKIDLKSAIEEHARLQQKVFPHLQLGLLHGRMTAAAKDEVIQAFRQGSLQIVVSTTVVEVGVDVPNASVMLIEHAERFGLSQLHQLRGRVGRGADQSYCLLMTGSRSEDARQRLNVMEQSTDGFFIAEMDLRFRGPGEVLGTRQSGLPDFALASLMQDQDILELARHSAQELIARDPQVQDYPLLRQHLQQHLQKLSGVSLV